MKAVVFGGAGFLGSHVADALTNAKYDVTIFDTKPSPYLTKNQKMFIGDIIDETAINRAVKGADVVYNFAGISDIERANKNPVETVKFNVMGNVLLLEACRKAKIKKYVFASSIYVYSDAGAFYRTSKQASELFIENYSEVFGLPYTIIRYGSIYGPRSGEENWIYRILKQALTDKKIVRYGDGEEIREYIHVKDAAECSVDLLKKEYNNQCVIITGSQQMKIKDLLTMVKEIARNGIDLEYRALNDSRCPHSAKLHYEVTPYVFSPKLGLKLMRHHYIDFGQGILELLSEIAKDGAFKDNLIKLAKKKK